jgi:excisionase family DNA binding protein
VTEPVATTTAVLVLDARSHAHLLAALQEHRARLARTYRTLPRPLEDLLLSLQLPAAASSGQARTDVDLALNDPHADAVLVDLATAARFLAVSERAVRRLVADGDLPSVLIGRSRRIHRDDIDAYLRTQRGLAPREDPTMPSKARAQRARQQLQTIRPALTELQRDYTAQATAAANLIDPNLTLQGLQERRQELQQAAREVLGEMAGDIRTGLGTDVQVLVDYAQLLRPPLTADSVRQTRLWDRTRALLESGRTLDTVLRTIDDTDTLLVLHDELPAWLRAQTTAPRGLDAAGWEEPDVDQALARVDARLAEIAGGDIREAMQWGREALALQAELNPMLDHLEQVANNTATSSGGLQAAIAGRIASRTVNPTAEAS